MPSEVSATKHSRDEKQPAAVAKQMAELARVNERSMSAEIRLAIKNHLAWTKNG